MRSSWSTHTVSVSTTLQTRKVRCINRVVKGRRVLTNTPDIRKMLTSTTVPGEPVLFKANHFVTLLRKNNPTNMTNCIDFPTSICDTDLRDGDQIPYNEMIDCIKEVNENPVKTNNGAERLTDTEMTDRSSMHGDQNLTTK